MKLSQDFVIPFVGLKLGKHIFDFKINQTFLHSYDYNEFERLDAEVKLTFDKKSTFLELDFKHKGIVEVNCDRSGELFDLPIKGKLKLIVKFGEFFNNEHDEILVLPHGTAEVDVSQYIYEMIFLSIPAKRLHPDIKKDKPLYESDSNIETQETDPRWDNLKKLIINNKQ
jgi:uncharacterized metal-binding protein YceD (DUF177 family)